MGGRMVGNWKFNVFFGLVALVFTLLFSLPNNTWQTTIFRGSIGFFIFYILAYLVRAIFFLIISRKTKQVIASEIEHENEAADPLKEEEESNDFTFESQFESIPLHALHKEGKTNNL
jgi:uncharacterized membrane protein